ncbi:MAG: phosphatase PAP2 family protein [Candidatus Thermoplasmatota archaeon]|nr:phosphatase PAP2 family protein [Candidatus Thermoplasmatota archaeon]
MWLLLFGLANLILFIFAVFFLLDIKQIKKIKFTLGFFIQKILENIKPLLIIIIIVVFHLIEVKILDPYFTNWVGYDYANIIKNLENGFVYSFTNYWIPGILYFFVIIYIFVYVFTLWFAPLYFIIADKKQSLKTLAYGLLIIYLVALPFYLFFPISNVYTYYSSASALETVMPSIEKFFYVTTTTNNCLPSLHTAMSILVAYCFSLTGNKKLKYFGIFVAITVIISVLYLSMHWFIDVFAGIILSLGAIFLLKRYIKDK